MKTQATKLQYIVGKRNGRFYKIFLNDLKSVKSCGKKNRPKVPDFEEPKQEKQMPAIELNFAPFEIETC